MGDVIHLRTGMSVDSTYVNASFAGSVRETTRGGGGGGMDPWQSSVETRLASLDNRAGRIEETLSSVRADVSSVKTKVEDLPTKWWIVTAVSAIGAAVVVVAKLIDLAF